MLDQQFGSALFHRLAVQVARQALERLVEQLLVAVVGGEQAQHFAGGGGRVPGLQPGHHEALDALAHRALVQQVQRLQRPAARHPRQLPRLLWLRQPLAQPGRRVEHLQPCQQVLRFQEVVAHERGQAVGDARLVARDDGGVRDRQAQRVAEQRHHREPVGQRAHRGRFAERRHPGPHALVAHRVAEHEAGDHGQQHRHGDGLHPAQLGAARVGGHAGRAAGVDTRTV